jgi:hypothetical protein
MTTRGTLSPEDQAASEAMVAAAIAACRAAGVTDGRLLAELASEVATATWLVRAQAGDAQAARITLSLTTLGLTDWIATEEAAGRPCFTTAETVRRINAAAKRRPGPV